jgi:hypothetical protein
VGFIDVAIPAVAGVLLVAAPGVFVKPGSDAAAHAKKIKWIRAIGVVLMVVAALYLLIKLFGR